MPEGTIAHYRVVREIGRGGMGVVCMAEDLRLGRMVALKFLPPQMSSDAQRRDRLLREARTASSLDHPNICTIHEIEDAADGQIVLVMSYYEGETLSARIERGRLELDESLEIARRILMGLAHAHERGVVHRDIKPSNVILTRAGGVKIVDFGLAKLHGSSEGLTETDALVGTMAYLPPELLHGYELDHRGDLWSSGVVLYEMLAGAPPFAGSNSYAVLHAILHDEARSIHVHRPELPPWTQNVLSRALAKQRDQRYQSAQEFLDELESFANSGAADGSHISPPPSVSVLEKSIVVLPFTVLGKESRDEIFSDGLTEEIIADLSSIAGLRVISPSSARRLKGVDDIRKVAAELNVRYVMEGTVRTAGDQLRVTAKLVDPSSGSLLWAEKYSGSLEDIFAIQESLSRRIVEALKLKLSPTESLRLADKPIADLRAYEFYLRAKHEILSYTAEGLERALGYLQQGEQIVGENVVLLSAKGQAYWQYVNAGISTDPKYLEAAEVCARRILEIDPLSPHGHRLLGLLAIAQGKTQEAVHLLRKSLEANPNDPDTMSWYCALCSMSGKGYAVAGMAQRLVEIDPLTPMWHVAAAMVAQFSGDFARAVGAFERALASEPRNTMLHLAHAQALAMDGRTAEALAEFDALAASPEPDYFVRLGVFYALALRGEHDLALAAAGEELRAASLADLNYAWILAQGYALLGERTLALEGLHIAVEKGFINYPLLSRLDPMLSGLRGDPEFAALMDATRQQWEAFEV